MKSRIVVRLVGGAEVAGGGGAFNVGKRNLLAARNLLWKHGVMIRGECRADRRRERCTWTWVQDGSA